jgi:hypothetical protein
MGITRMLRARGYEHCGQKLWIGGLKNMAYISLRIYEHMALVEECNFKSSI